MKLTPSVMEGFFYVCRGSSNGRAPVRRTGLVSVGQQSPFGGLPIFEGLVLCHGRCAFESQLPVPLLSCTGYGEHLARRPIVRRSRTMDTRTERRCQSCGRGRFWLNVKVIYLRFWQKLGFHGPECMSCHDCCGGFYYRFRDPARYASH